MNTPRGLQLSRSSAEECYLIWRQLGKFESFFILAVFILAVSLLFFSLRRSLLLRCRDLNGGISEYQNTRASTNGKMCPKKPARLERTNNGQKMP